MINNILLRLAGLSLQRTLLLTLVAAALYYFTLFNDGSNYDRQIENVNKQINEAQAKSKEADQALKEVDQVRASIGTLSEQFQLTAQQLPSEIQMADVLRSVDTLARSSGISIKTKEPKPSRKDEIVETFPLRVLAEGTYSELTMFMYYLSSMERITRVLNFSMAPPATVGATEKYAGGRLVFDGEIVSYRYMGREAKEVKKK